MQGISPPHRAGLLGRLFSAVLSVPACCERVTAAGAAAEPVGLLRPRRLPARAEGRAAFTPLSSAATEAPRSLRERAVGTHHPPRGLGEE